MRRVSQPHELTRTKECLRCEQTKPWAEFAPTVYDADGLVLKVRGACHDCDAERSRERRRQQAQRGPGTGHARTPQRHEYIFTKRCSGCGETKPWAKFPPALYNEDGSVHSVQSRCTRCSGSRREYQREWAKRNADRTRARRNALQRKRRARLRISREPQSGPRLSLDGFLVWLAKAEQEHDGLLPVADLVGIDEAVLRRKRDGREQHVTLRVADQCFTRTGYHLNDFYPETTEMAA